MNNIKHIDDGDKSKQSEYNFYHKNIFHYFNRDTPETLYVSPYLDGILFRAFIKKSNLAKELFVDVISPKKYSNTDYIPKKLTNDIEFEENILCCNSSKQDEKNNPNDDDEQFFQDIYYNDFFTSKTSLRKKKKKRRPLVTICITNCKSEAVKRVASNFGLKEVDEDEGWNIYWTDINITISKAKEMKRFQRINHFLGMHEICRKDLLAKNLTRMQKCFPGDYNFFPKSWCLPIEYNDAVYYNKLHKNKIFIIKPEAGCQGRGIFITKNINEINKNAKLICQVYISKPYLIDGFKFDIRVYCLISSCDPLRVFVYNEGLVRFATMRYAEPNIHNCSNVFMHLTNYAVNKQNHDYKYHRELGSKRKISTLNGILKSRGIDTMKLWKLIDDAIVKTIISAWPILKHNYNTCFSSHDMFQACFEILGFDVLLDHNLNPYILEVNHSPSLHTDSLIDKEVKENLLIDTLTLLNVWNCDKRKVMEEDRQRIQNRLNQKSGTYRSNLDNTSVLEKEPLKEKLKSPWQDQIEWEENNLGNFRRVYPNGDEYSKYFQQPSNSLFLSTTSSRARGECAKLQRDEIEAKLTKNEANKLPSVPKPLKTITNHNERQHQMKKEKSIQKNTSKSILPKIAKQRQTVYDPSDPVPIIGSEERQRLALSDQRRRLIENRGVIELIYQIMKCVGTLTPNDEMKYSHYTRVPKTKTETFESLAM